LGLAAPLSGPYSQQIAHHFVTSMAHRQKSSGPTQRMLRVGELVRHALSAFLTRGEIDDEALQSAVITVPEVRMSPDLKLASAYIMPLGGERAVEIVEALNHHKRFIRGQIAPELDLKFAPELRFFVDETFDEADRIDALLRSERVARDLSHEEDGEN
jgi:ribosome-binding factor A